MSSQLYFILLPRQEAEKLFDLMASKGISPEAQLLFAQVLGCQYNNLSKGKDYPSIKIQWAELKEVFPKVGQIHAKELAANNFFIEISNGKSSGFRVNESLFMEIVKGSTGLNMINFTDYIIDQNRLNQIAQITVKEYEELKATIEALKEKVGV